MYSLKNYVFFGLVILGLSSCEKETTEENSNNQGNTVNTFLNPGADTEACLLSEINDFWTEGPGGTSGTEVYKIDYNDRKISKLYSPTEPDWSAEMSYNESGQLTEVKWFEDGILDDTYKFSYSGSQLVSVSEGDGEDVSNFTYSKGKIVTEENISYFEGIPEDTTVYEYTYDSKGNVIKEQEFRFGILEEETTYTYDNNKSYRVYFVWDYDIQEVVSPNNVLSRTRKTFDLQGNVVSSETENYTYTYNSNGYPTSSLSDDPNEQSDTFVYDCP